MNSLNFARSKHSPLNKGRQEEIFYKTLVPNHSPFERRRELREIVKNPPTPFIKVEMYSFPSPTTGEGIKGGGFKKKFHSIPSPLGRGLGGGFTLVELIVVVTILAILGTIAFISLQGYSQDARDSKRISDTRSLISKITIENTKGISYSEIMNEEGIKENTLMINGKSQTGTQNVREPINRDILKENRENFVDPTNNHPYPFAYAIGNSNGQLYNFMQLAYVSEKIGLTKLAGNYYKMNEVDDSPSLFVGCITNPDEEIEENGCPIYDVGVGYTPPVYANCEPQQVTTTNVTYDITESRNHRGEITLTITGTLLLNSYTEYTQIFKCNDGTFEKKKGTEESSKLVCINGYSGNNCEILPPVSCKALLEKISSTNSGEYYIDPDGEGGIAPFKVYCDMTTEGGGWTVIVNTASNQAIYDEGDTGYDMTKSWNWKREYVNKLSFTKVAIKYADGDNTQILDYNETYKAYYNGSYAVQIYSTCVARTGNMCSGNSSTVAWGYFCRNGNPFSQTGGSSSSAWPGSVPYANSDNSGSRKCNSSNRTTYGTEFGTYVMVR